MLSEVTGPFPWASSVTARPSPGSWAQREKLEADSRLRPPPDTPVSERHLPRRQGQLYPTRQAQTLACRTPRGHCPKEESPIPGQQWGYTLSYQGATGFLLLCTTAAMMPGPACLEK